MVRTQHVQDEEVVITVAVDVGKIDAHGKNARVAQSEARKGLESAFAGIDPDAVGRLEIVADIDIGSAIAVHIAKHHREAPVIRWLGERLSVFVQEVSAGERKGSEPSAAIVEVKRVRFPVFLERAIGGDGESSYQVRIGNGPVIESYHGRPALHGVNFDVASGLVAD